MGTFRSIPVRQEVSEISDGIRDSLSGVRQQKFSVEVELEICTAYKAGDSPLLLDYKMWSYWRMWS